MEAPHVKDLAKLKEKAFEKNTSVKDVIQRAHEYPDFRFSEAEVGELMAVHGRNFYEFGTQVQEGGQNRLISVSQTLNTLMEKDESGSDLDGFQRLLRHYRLPIKNDLSAGVYAATMDCFFETPQKTALVPEFISRQLLKQAEETYDLGDIVAELIMSPNGTFKQPKLDLTGVKAGFSPVGEYTRAKPARIKFGEVSTSVFKRGIAFQVSYEAMKDVPLNLLALFIQRVAMKDSEDLLGRAIAKLVEAAGTPTSKTAVGATGVVETADDGNINIRTWLKMTRMTGGHYWDRCFASSDVAEAIMTMAKPGNDLLTMSDIYAGLLREKMGVDVSLSNIRRKPVQIIEHEDIAAKTVVFIDRRYALLHIKEIGVDMEEYDKIINGRFHEVVVTRADDFSVFDSTSVKSYDEI